MISLLAHILTLAMLPGYESNMGRSYNCYDVRIYVVRNDRYDDRMKCAEHDENYALELVLNMNLYRKFDSDINITRIYSDTKNWLTVACPSIRRTDPVTARRYVEDNPYPKLKSYRNNWGYTPAYHRRPCFHKTALHMVLKEIADDEKRRSEVTGPHYNILILVHGQEVQQDCEWIYFRQHDSPIDFVWSFTMRFGQQRLVLVEGQVIQVTNTIGGDLSHRVIALTDHMRKAFCWTEYVGGYTKEPQLPAPRRLAVSTSNKASTSTTTLSTTTTTTTSKPATTTTTTTTPTPKTTSASTTTPTTTTATPTTTTTTTSTTPPTTTTATSTTIPRTTSTTTPTTTTTTATTTPTTTITTTTPTTTTTTTLKTTTTTTTTTPTTTTTTTAPTTTSTTTPTTTRTSATKSPTPTTTSSTSTSTTTSSTTTSTQTPATTTTAPPTLPTASSTTNTTAITSLYPMIDNKSGGNGNASEKTTDTSWKKVIWASVGVFLEIMLVTLVLVALWRRSGRRFFGVQADASDHSKANQVSAYTRDRSRISAFSTKPTSKKTPAPLSNRPLIRLPGSPKRTQKTPAPMYGNRPLAKADSSPKKLKNVPIAPSKKTKSPR